MVGSLLSSLLPIVALTLAARSPRAGTCRRCAASTIAAASCWCRNSSRCSRRSSTYTAGFIAEIVRGGILAVPQGPDRGRARRVGLRPRRILRLVVIPQALRVMIPPMTSQYLNVLKNSSFGAAIAYPELVSVFMGSALNNTGQAIEIIAITLGVYLAIGLCRVGVHELVQRPHGAGDAMSARRAALIRDKAVRDAARRRHHARARLPALARLRAA